MFPTRRFLLSTLALAAGLSSLNAAEARTLAQIKQSGVLRVATPGDLPPFTVADGTRFTGYEVELLQAVAASLGLKVELQKVAADGLIKALQDDRADVAVGALGVTSTRENRVDFTTPTACAGVSVASLNPALQKHTDLAGRSIGVGAGSIMHSYVQKLPFEKQVKVYKSTGDVLFAVLTKAVDATFAYTVMEPAIKRNYSKVKVYFGPELWSVPIGFMVREDNDSTRLALNAAIQTYFATNSYAFLSSKHFGKDVRCKS
ncbi:transporter substrate-binding domain-containing protein [Deinococcus sp. MIMF12]|uniref:Transporter substrate-binding domain-containing protein n=1 Tax=Deinococcus rhizophilus TaxID=3049544 RepID=A0ABT7JFA2_9DEIO|nr:transporter substrate-binding domain-containing protein [Deinococcus rhizophilus]MDL2343726.1 transporter substrate-binding domain-containing protein [Deinococcus rhizophilus]